MKLPTGRRLAESTDSVADLLKQYGLNFKGSINVYNTSEDLSSNGFILMDNGTVLASAYTMMNITLYQFSALDRMMTLTSLRSEILALTDDEIRAIMSDYQHAALVSGDGKDAAVVEAQAEVPQAPLQQVPAVPVPEPAAVPEPAGPVGYEQLVSAFTTLPGVLGSALVAEGFPVYQHGKDVDFEHIAAATEDMVRAGTRIASELQLGDTGQIILETPGYKVIIAPINDMFLCVIAQSNTNLGLIRLNIKNAQRSQGA